MVLTDPTVLALMLTGGAGILVWNLFKKKKIEIQYVNDENGRIFELRRQQQLP